jgi:Erv1 / Alr family
MNIFSLNDEVRRTVLSSRFKAGQNEEQQENLNRRMDPEVWGPYYWFFIYTIAYNYPEYVNQVTKRKYYDFIQNLPLFIPISEMGDRFASLLDRYPVSPYLDSRDSFLRWVHFIHNKYNIMLGKEEISLQESIEHYLEKFRTKPIRLTEYTNIRRHIMYLVLFLTMCFMIYILYK